MGQLSLFVCLATNSNRIKNKTFDDNYSKNNSNISNKVGNRELVTKKKLKTKEKLETEKKFGTKNLKNFE